MRVLLVHNYYQQPGGEDVGLRAEKELLQDAGHEDSLFEVSNDNIRGFASKLKVAIEAVYSFAQRQKLREVLKKTTPDIVHVHNFYPLLTPSIYDACRDVDVPVVLTLHNYRRLCPESSLCETERFVKNVKQKGLSRVCGMDATGGRSFKPCPLPSCSPFTNGVGHGTKGLTDL